MPGQFDECRKARAQGRRRGQGVMSASRSSSVGAGPIGYVAVLQAKAPKHVECLIADD